MRTMLSLNALLVLVWGSCRASLLALCKQAFPEQVQRRPLALPQVIGTMLGSSGAGWSSLAARRAHNPKVVGSNPTPATNYRLSTPSKLNT
jgi:hypothetical protein